MKSVILFSLLSSSVATYGANLPAKCENLAAQVKAQVVSKGAIEEENNIVNCTFKVAVSDAQLDQVCPADLGELEMSTFVDPSCSIEVGHQFNHIAVQYFSTKDMNSRGLFYWFGLAGYQSEIVFPNYRK